MLLIWTQEIRASFLSSHVAKFVIGKGGDLTITRLATNPIYHCENATFKPSELDKDAPFLLKRGDILGFLGIDHQYRIDPYDFENPPTNTYHIEKSSPSSTNTSWMNDEEEVDRAQEAKRPFSTSWTTKRELPHEGLPPRQKPIPKPKKPANPAMDWLVEDEGGGELDPGDFEYKPGKYDETASTT